MIFAGALEFTAVGAVVVGRDEESGVRIDRLAVKGQMLNSLGLRIDTVAFAVVARRLGDINLVVHAINDVEVVSAEAVPVNQRLRLAAGGVNLIELPGGALQPLFHLFTAHFHHHQGVGIQVEIGGIAEGELTFFHFHKAGRIVFPSADFKRRGGGEYRQLRQIRVALNIVLHIGFLGHVDYLYGRVVLHQRQVAVHIIRGFTDRFADKLAGGVMVGF